MLKGVSSARKYKVSVFSALTRSRMPNLAHDISVLDQKSARGSDDTGINECVEPWKVGACLAEVRSGSA